MSSRISLWLLASAGVLVGHVAAYLVAYPGDAERAVALGGHAYLGPVGTVLIPLGLVGVLGMGVRTVRRIGAAPSLPRLAGLQVALFAAQEVLERVAGPGAAPDVLTERAVWVGLLAQVVVAWLSLRLVALAAVALRSVTGGARHPRGATPAIPAAFPPVRAPGASVAARLPRRRGPPVLAGPVPST